MNLNQANSFNFFKSDYNNGTKRENCGDGLINCGRRGNSYDNRLLASLKIFAFIMLQSWRKSRNEITQLKQSIEGLKKSSSRKENQIRVYGSLIRVEQSRTDELTSQLKRILDNLKRKRTSYMNFSITLSNLKNSQALLEQELKKRYQESDALNRVLAQTKKQLFRSMLEQRRLHSQLCKEQLTVQSLEKENNFLISEICGLNTEHRRAKENFTKRLQDKDYEIIEAKRLLGNYQATFIDVHKNYNFYDRTQSDFVKTQTALPLPRFHATSLKSNSHTSIRQHLGTFWTRFIAYPKYTLNRAHILIYYLLPAMPSPSK